MLCLKDRLVKLLNNVKDLAFKSTIQAVFTKVSGLKISEVGKDLSYTRMATPIREAT